MWTDIDYMDGVSTYMHMCVDKAYMLLITVLLSGTLPLINILVFIVIVHVHTAYQKIC